MAALGIEPEGRGSAARMDVALPASMRSFLQAGCLSNR